MKRHIEYMKTDTIFGKEKNMPRTFKKRAKKKYNFFFWRKPKPQIPKESKQLRQRKTDAASSQGTKAATVGAKRNKKEKAWGEKDAKRIEQSEKTQFFSC